MPCVPPKQTRRSPRPEGMRHLKEAMTSRQLVATHPKIPLYDREDVHREIRTLAPLPTHPDDLPDGDDTLSNEDRQRLKTLQRILASPLGSERQQLIGSPQIAGRLLAVKSSAPHFGEFINLIARAVVLSHCTATYLRLPPILLLGSPGIGKTYVARRIARALGTSTHEIAGCI